MDIHQVDLNLLKAFDAMIRTRSVTQAGIVLGLSQPAMSFALSKLRQMFDDPLFVRSARGMEPTARAQELAEPVTRMLYLIQDEILPRPTFHPASSHETFVMCMSDIGEMVFLPRLLRHLDGVAPHVKIKTVAPTPQELEVGLTEGDIALAVGVFPDLESASIRQKLLHQHSFVCVMRIDHPDIGQTMTKEEYEAADHVAVRPEGRRADQFEKTLERLGVHRNVRLSLPRYMGVPFIVADSNMIATVPLMVGRRFADFARVRLMPLPFNVPAYDLHLHWHSRFHNDPANVWMRDVMSALVSTPKQPSTVE
ncbi:LysR family transcriptional regulator [Pandoraea communis]|uniref:LysR family transcriptional regulator n=1 Tax=Pandoraea communis TaxID=2508297 RepID=A0A5E4WJJ7_9BURK|nr:LysR family transcriptional regulator [Pandoraea communis]MDM8358807.1 LysR family transcriptional regulator [Pandoraea communis]VVE24972.1 LysR family transcriptional regulator [Pandoraea communis]